MFAEGPKGHLQQNFATGQMAGRNLDRHRLFPGVEVLLDFRQLGLIEVFREQQRLSPWEVDPRDSGFGGLVLGVAEAWGRVLLGTEGWRSQFCKPLALFVRSRTSIAVDTGSVQKRYGIPVLRDLDALVSEWGPDRRLQGIPATA